MGVYPGSKSFDSTLASKRGVGVYPGRAYCRGLTVYTSQLELCASDEELQLVFAIDEALSLLMETGFNKPICQLKLSDKTYIRAVAETV